MVRGRPEAAASMSVFFQEAFAKKRAVESSEKSAGIDFMSLDFG
jgi:hypothetical protein